MRKIVVAIDSMKGCLESKAASEAFALGVRKAFPEAKVVAMAVADGGEGTSEAIANGKEGVRKITSQVTGPLGKPVDAEWWFDESASEAYIDMASAAGLTLIDDKEKNPMHTTSYGVGELINEAVKYSAKHIILGLGGSATVDGGLGACQALGVKLIDAEGNVLGSPFTGGMLNKVADIEISDTSEKLQDVRLSLACDVAAPLTGNLGAAQVFGPQKGASPDDVEFLDRGLENIRQIVLRKMRIELNEVPGSGAAGGMAGGIMAFAGGKIEKGAPLVLDAIGFDNLIKDAVLIVTGEGSSDAQTLMGKIPFEILQRGLKRGIPVWLVAGKIAEADALYGAGYAKIMDINSPDNIVKSNTEGEEAMDPVVASRRLKSVGETLCQLIKKH